MGGPSRRDENESGKTGIGLIVQVASAIVQTDAYSVPLHNFLRDLPLLDADVPCMKKLAKDFKDTDISDADQFNIVLEEAFDLVCTHMKHAPEGLLDNFSKMVEGVGVKFFDGVLKQLRGNLEDNTSHCAEKKALAKLAAEALQSLTLHFPMLPWCADKQAEIAEALQGLDNADFSDAFVAALHKVEKEAGGKNPPATKQLMEAVAKGCFGVHFVDAKAQRAIKQFVHFVATYDEKKTDAAWCSFFEVASEVAKFVVDNQQSRALNGLVVFLHAHTLQKAMSVVSVDQMRLEAKWQDPLSTMMRARDRATTVLKNLLDNTGKDDVDDVFDGEGAITDRARDEGDAKNGATKTDAVTDDTDGARCSGRRYD